LAIVYRDMQQFNLMGTWYLYVSTNGS